MQIEISNENGCAQVKIVNPSSGAVVNTAVVEDGQEVTVTATSAHEVSDIEVGEVSTIGDESASDTGGECGDESSTDTGEQSEGDTATEDDEASQTGKDAGDE